MKGKLMRLLLAALVLVFCAVVYVDPSTFAKRLCREQPQTYMCVKIKIPRGARHQYLEWADMFPNITMRNILMAINRRDTLLWRGQVVAIPRNYIPDQMIYSPFPGMDTKYQKRTIVVDLKQLAWAAYERGLLVRWGIANGGRGRCKETGRSTCKTPVGTWSVYEIKKGFARSSLYPITCADKKKCGHPYYNVMKFGPHSEALHGERAGHVPGINASHGCVRIPRADSQYLVDHFVSIGTTVVIRAY